MCTVHTHTMPQADNDEAARLWEMLLRPVLPVILMFSRTTWKQELHREEICISNCLKTAWKRRLQGLCCWVFMLMPPPLTCDLVEEKSTNNQAHMEAIGMKIASKGCEDTAT